MRSISNASQAVLFGHSEPGAGGGAIAGLAQVLADLQGAEVQEPSRNGAGEPGILLELVVEPGEATLFERFAALQLIAHLRDEFAQDLFVGPALLVDASLHGREVEVAGAPPRPVCNTFQPSACVRP
jgi:hypothetical protein